MIIQIGIQRVSYQLIFYKDKPFLTHLKGGFSENKMSSKAFEEEFNEYLQELKNAK